MKMLFVFDDSKARVQGLTAQACYDAVDKLFARFGIVPTAQGVYEAPDDQNTFTAFGVAQRLPYTDWFLKVIDVWRAYEDEDLPDEFEDCLALHYDYAVRNGRA